MYPDVPLRTKEYTSKHSARMKASNTLEVRRKKSESMKKVWEKEDYKEKMYEVHVKVQNSEDLQKRKSKALKKTWEKEHDRIVKCQKEAQKREDVKQKKSEAGRRNWENPEYRKKVRANKSIRVFEDGSVVRFRSSWENKLSCYLDELKIPWDYEYKGFPYISPDDGKEHSYYPDFRIKLPGKKEFYLEVKPSNQVDTEINLIKIDSVLKSGIYVDYITEDDIEDIETFQKKFLEVQRLSEEKYSN